MTMPYFHFTCHVCGERRSVGIDNPVFPRPVRCWTCGKRMTCGTCGNEYVVGGEPCPACLGLPEESMPPENEIIDNFSVSSWLVVLAIMIIPSIIGALIWWAVS